MRKHSVIFSALTAAIILLSVAVLPRLSFARSYVPAPHLVASLTPHIISSQSGFKLSDHQKGFSSLLACTRAKRPPLCYSPEQIRRAYGIQPLLDNGVTGQGQTIVVIDDYQNSTLHSDLGLFDRIFGLNDPKLRIIAPQGLSAASGFAAIGFGEEISLDVEWAHAIAPGASIDLVLGNPADDSLKRQIDALIKATLYAVNHHLGNVLSLSVGLGETCYSPTEIKQWHQAFEQAQQEDISVLVSSGDSGAAAVQCDKNGTPLRMIQGIDYPASDPFVTSVGGTTLQVTHASGYERETVWDDELFGVGSGGGFSSLFAAPDYQRGIAGIGTQRAVPDIAYNADPATGVPVVVTVANATLIVSIGGTSAGAPQWAAIIALAEQSLGRSLGFLNPFLYHLDEKSFHDVTTGNNTVAGGVDAHYHPVTIRGYNAEPAWDPTTGWGSPNVAHLAQLL